MAVYQEIVDFNQVFRTLKTEPLVINDLNDTSEENREVIEKLIITKYTGDMLSVLPSCQCTKTQGEYAIGSSCPECGTLVESVIEDSIEPLLWFRKPNGVRSLINPAILNMLSVRFKKGGFEIIRWLTDTHYKPNVKIPRSIQMLQDNNIARGYNNFVDNFDYIMSVLFGMKDFSTKNPSEDMLEELLRRDRHKLFSDYIPLPNKALLIIEKNNLGVYADLTIADAIDAMFMVTAIDTPMSNHTVRTKENRTIKALFKLNAYYTSFIKKSMLGKPGVFRRHIFGSRTHFSFRAVASSITEAHRYDEIYAPWGVGISCLRIHLINKLLRLGWQYNKAAGLLMEHIEKYHPLLDQLMQELIYEAPNHRIEAIIQRNPSLLQGSAQAVGLTRIKTNPADPTVSLSILIVKAPNCDFDGDELNITLAVDNHLAGLWAHLAPHHNVFVLDEPGVVSGNVAIPKPVVATMSRWLASGDAATYDDTVWDKFNSIPTM